MAFNHEMQLLVFNQRGQHFAWGADHFCRPGEFRFNHADFPNQTCYVLDGVAVVPADRNVKERQENISKHFNDVFTSNLFP